MYMTMMTMSGLVSSHFVWYLLSYVIALPGLTWLPIGQKRKILPAHLASHPHLFVFSSGVVNRLSACLARCRLMLSGILARL